MGTRYQYKKIDKDLVQKIVINDDEYIRISDLEKELDELKRQFSELPKPKKEPDQDTLDLWNSINNVDYERIRLETEIKEKQELIDKLKEL